MATKNNRRVLMTKKLLKEGLIEILSEKEISQVSIRELCERADLNRSTFYLHYTDQFDLLREIEEDVISNTIEQFKDTKERVISPFLIERFLNHVKDNGTLFKVLLCKKESVDFKEKLIHSTIAELSKSLEFYTDSKLLSYTYAFLLDGCSAILIKWIDGYFKEDSSSIARLIFGLCESVRKTKI